MSKIRIKNFGPIKEGYLENDGWMDVKKVTVFIGNQGSGKSTVAKVISTLTWMEKALNRGDISKPGSLYDFQTFFEYQGLTNYFKENTTIEYHGNSFYIAYNIKDNPWTICEKKETGNYVVPKIMYVPAERNFLSVVKNAYGAKNLPGPLFTFAEELRKGQLELKSQLLTLPIGNVSYKYKREFDQSFIVGEDYELDLAEASSGYQSFIPLYLVTKFLSDLLQKNVYILRELLSVEQSIRRNEEIAKVMFQEQLGENERMKKINEIDSRYLNKCFINIVEEPEQNLYPTSQRTILNNLLAYNNFNNKNKLILTTHSPYIINYLTLCVKAETIYKLLEEKKYKLSDPDYTYMNDIVPMSSIVHRDDLVIYELKENIGTINILETYNGLPSDENYLNERLAESNELFAQLLEIQQHL